MAVVDFGRMRECIDVPPDAERLLAKCEKAIRFSLNLLLHPDGDGEATR
jgi:hypothetical protein